MTSVRLSAPRPGPAHATRPTPTVGRVAVAVVLAAVAVPVLAVVVRTLWPDGVLDLEAFGRIATSARTWRLVAVTVAQAVGSSLLTLAIGVPTAWVLATYRFPGRRLLRTIATVPFVLPSVVVGAAFASLLGPRGLVDARGTWWPILAAHLAFNLAVVLRTVGAAIGSVDPDLVASARLLGAGPFGAARRVVLPAIAPAVAAAAVIVFLFCLTTFGVVVILGGGSVSTLEVEIWTRSTRQFDLSGAGVLCLLQLVAVVATLAVHARVVRHGTGTGAARRSALRRPRSPAAWAAVASATLAVLVVSVTPIAALAERSLRSTGGWSTTHWRNLGSVTAGTGLRVAPVEAVVVSVSTSLVATVVAVALALPAVRVAAGRPGGGADRVLLLPLGVSSTTIGLGLLLAFGRPPLDLRRSWWVVPAAQALVALPLVVRALLPAVRALPPSLREAAALQGATPGQQFRRVELPMVRRALAAGAGLALVACLGEFGATVFLARTGSPTVPVAIERLMSRPGGAGFGQAMALSCVLVLVCVVVVVVVDRLVEGRDDASGAGVIL